MPQTTVVKTADGPMDLYVAEPASTPSKAVIVLQEAFGVNDHIEDIARRLAKEGYLAVAPHLFHRSGGGIIPYTEFAQAAPHLGALDDELIAADIDATLHYLEESGVGAASIGVIGFCLGGRVAFLTAASRSIGGAVSFYGTGIVSSQAANRPPLVGLVDSLATPWLGLFGEQDEAIPVADIDTLEAALASAPVETALVRYAAAGHGFHCDQRPSYHPESAVDAWARAVAWLDSHIG